MDEKMGLGLRPHRNEHTESAKRKGKNRRYPKTLKGSLLVLV